MKKAEGLLFPPLVWGIIALIVLVIIILAFTQGFGKGIGSLGGFQGQVDDCDRDGVSNLFDKCKYLAGTEEYEGCSNADDLAKSALERDSLCPGGNCVCTG